MAKTKKQSVSLFGINDCHKPKKNYTFKKYSKKTMKLKEKPYNYKTIIFGWFKSNSK